MSTYYASFSLSVNESKIANMNEPNIVLTTGSKQSKQANARHFA